MATATATTVAACATVDPDHPPPPLRLNSIPTIDLHLLSQSELYSLSKCSNSSSDLNRCDDVVIPKIDRSVFNESAGSRKQTYSRLRLAPPGSSKTAIHRRTSRLLSPHTPATNNINVPELAESSQIIGVLKELFNSHSNFEGSVPTPVEKDSNVSTKTSDSNIEQVSIVVENDSNVSAKTSDSNTEQVPIAFENDSSVSTKAPDINFEQAPTAVENGNNASMKATDTNFEEVPIAVENDSNMSKKTSDGGFEELVPIAVEDDSTMSKKTSDFSYEQLVPIAVENDSSMSKKQSDSSFEHLVPIAVEKDSNLSNVVVPNSLNPEMKRKRGRPRKHENAVLIHPPAAKRMRNNTVKKVIVYDSEKDREIMNSRGVKINMTDLSRLEDPYGPEIRKRTEGLSTQDELLGFLRSINGQWGTTRKKRRIVDASDFGDALPKGWRLSLCIKKKEGRVWLFCRRYISPSGRQFESCKDVSIYLISLIGEESLDKPSHTRSNDSNDTAMGGASGNAADVYVQEDLNRNSTIHNPPISLPTNCEKQVTPESVNVRAEEHFKCLKCFLIFDGKIDLLDHQALAHKDAAISDWSIVIGSIFDCRICHKTFYEKNKYNAHIGTHVTLENKTCEALEAQTAVKTVVVRESETHDAHVGDELISDSPQIEHKISCTESKTDKLVHDLNMNGDALVEEFGDGIGNNSNVGEDEVFETQKASVSKSSSGVGHEASISIIDETNGKYESSGGTVDCVDAKSECVFDPSSGNSHLSPSVNEPDSISVGGKTVIGNSVSAEVLSHVVSETRVQSSSFRGKKDFGENINDTHICNSFDELTSEKEKVVNSESSSAAAATGVFNGRLAEANKFSEPESLSLFSPSRTNTTKGIKNSSFIISSKHEDSSQKEGFHSVDENRFSYAIASSKLDARYEVRSSAFDNYNMSSMDGDGVTSVEKEVNFKSHSPMNKEAFHIQNNVNNAYLDKSGEANLDDLQIFRNNESINNEVASLGSNQNSLNAAGAMAFNTRKNIEFSSLLPPGSGNDQSFSFQDDDDVTGMYDNTQGGSSSERGLLDHFCVDETSDDIFGNKMMYSTPLDGLKFDEDRGLGIHDLNLAFGNPNALYEDSIQKKDAVNCSVVSSSKINNDTFDVQTDLSMVNKRMADDLKRANETRVLQHDASNPVYSGRTWDNLRSDEFTSSEDNKYMIASGSNQQQCNEVVPRGMWKPAQGNQLQSGLVNPHSQIQAPSFHSFDIMSNKAQDGVYRVDERYNTNVGSTVNGVRSSRSEPVEFRFLTGRSEPNPPHTLQGGSSSRGFPYNTAFEPPFWMGKNAMVPPNMMMGGRNMVTSVCAWCRNVFYLPAMAINPQTQAGVGSLCPNCTAGISG